MQEKWNMTIPAVPRACGIMMSETRLFPSENVKDILELKGLTGETV